MPSIPLVERRGRTIKTEHDSNEAKKASPWVLNTSKAQEELGWRPIQLHQGLDLAVNYYRHARSGERAAATMQRQLRAYLRLPNGPLAAGGGGRAKSGRGR